MFIKNECGGHRWQRVPPTEKKGRVHTSTVTVACIDTIEDTHVDLSNIEVIRTKDSGAGGQHRNKTESCVIIIDRNTGLSAKSATKSQHHNLKVAKDILTNRIKAQKSKKAKKKQNTDRKAQVGTGMRGDKIRTYRESDDLVKSHINDSKCSLSSILKGEIQRLW